MRWAATGAFALPHASEPLLPIQLAVGAPPEATVIRELYDAAVRASRGWRSRPDGYERMREAWRVYREAAESLRVRLPFPTGVAYAYSPSERATTGSGVHIIVKAPEGIHIGRLKRAFGDALCRPGAKFWGLTEKDPGKEQSYPDCILCAERAARLAAAAPPEPP